MTSQHRSRAIGRDRDQRGTIGTLELILLLTLLLIGMLAGCVLVRDELLELKLLMDRRIPLQVLDSNDIRIGGYVEGFDLCEAPEVILKDATGMETFWPVYLGVRPTRFVSRDRVYFDGLDCAGTPYVAQPGDSTLPIGYVNALQDKTYAVGPPSNWDVGGGTCQIADPVTTYCADGGVLYSSSGVPTATTIRSVWVPLAPDCVFDPLPGAIPEGELPCPLGGDPGTVSGVSKISNLYGTPAVFLGDGDELGFGMASLGDVDGDGVPDIAASSPNADDLGFRSGSVWLFLMNPVGTVKTVKEIYSPDPSPVGARFGFAIGGMGDLDGNGVPDLAVSAERDNDGGTERGSVWLLLLDDDCADDTTPSCTYLQTKKISNPDAGGSASNDSFGTTAANLGDIDGNGVPDLGVGAYRDGGQDEGAFWILLLDTDCASAASAACTTIQSYKIANPDAGNTAFADTFARSMTAIGDLDSNGVTELAVGVYTDDAAGTNSGSVWIFFLGTDCAANSTASCTMLASSNKIPNPDLQPVTPEGDRAGSSTTYLGDLDGDGVPEIAVGGTLDADSGTRAGAIWIWFLNGDGTLKGYEKITEAIDGAGAPPYNLALDDQDRFGIGTASADLDGDGVLDLIAGAIYDDDGGTAGQDSNTGAAWVLFLNGIVVPTSCIPAPDDLVSWWPGDGDATDIAGANDGSLQGGATATGAGIVDQAFDFNGSTSEVYVDSDPSLNVQEFTIDAWVRPTAYNYIVNMIVNKEEAFRSPRQYEIGIRGPDPPTGPNPIPLGNLIFEIGTPAGARGTAPDDWGWYDSYASVPLGEWTHVALTFDNASDTAVTYVNGLATRVISDYGGDIPDTSGPFRIGARDDSDPAFIEKFTGQIDEVEFFDRALTACEIQQIYLAGAYGKCKASEPVFPDEVCENLTTSVTLELMPGASVPLDGMAGSANILSSFPPPFTVPPWDPLPVLEPIAPTPEGPATGTPDITLTPPTPEDDGLGAGVTPPTGASEEGPPPPPTP